MNKKFLLLILILIAGTTGLYAYLGGFNTPTVQVSTSKTYYVAGRSYVGLVDEKALGELFREAAKILEKKTLQGSLANIYYNNPEQQQDSIKAFVGISITDTTAALPAGYELRTVVGGKKVVQATVRAHYFLSPDKLYPALFDYIKQNRLQTTQRYLEVFPNQRQALVQAEIIP